MAGDAHPPERSPKDARSKVRRSQAASAAALRISVLVALAVFSASPAVADSYDSLIVRGVAARDRALETGSVQDWEEALNLFAMAADLRPTKEAKFEFAEAAVHVHLEDEACAAYEEALELGLRGRAEDRAHAFIGSHAQLMAGLAVEGPPGTTVFIADRKRAVLPLARPLLVSAGMLRVRLLPPKFREWEATVSLEAGKTTPLKAELVPEPVDAPAPASTVPRSSASEMSAPPPRWALPMLAGGAVVTFGSAAAIVFTTVLRDQQQRSLERDCAVLQGGQCVATTADKRASAQALADRVVSLESERWAAIGVTAIGSVAVSVALLQLVRGGGHRDPGGRGGIFVSSQGLAAEWRTAF